MTRQRSLPLANAPSQSNDIEAAQRWADNGVMIADVAKLHLNRDMRSIDVTYGTGVWWKSWKPKKLVKHDLYTVDGVDFCHLPHRAASFDLWAFDPEYVAQGGRKTSKLAYNSRYGMLTAPATPKLLRAQIVEGLREGHRILRPGGTGLFKCMNYVSSGHLQLGAKWGIDDAEEVGFEIHDIFYFIGNVRSQPLTRRQIVRTPDGKPDLDADGNKVYDMLPYPQQHARTNISMLLVLRKKPLRKKATK